MPGVLGQRQREHDDICARQGAVQVGEGDHLVDMLDRLFRVTAHPDDAHLKGVRELCRARPDRPRTQKQHGLAREFKRRLLLPRRPGGVCLIAHGFGKVAGKGEQKSEDVLADGHRVNA